MKIKYIYLFLLIAIFGNRQLFSQNKSKTNFKIIASYYPYTTAMGKGKGIIFRINIFSKSTNKISIDSFFVNSKSLPFIIKNNLNGVSIESNYLKSKDEPSALIDGNETKIPNEINDKIIVQKKFYPSWILVNQKGKHIKLYIKKYLLTEQKSN